MRILDEKGATLMEVMTVFVILLIVLPIIYGVFHTGYKLYSKINVEGQMRDDSDYTATMIMNAFYSTPFDFVRSCGDNCVELVENTKTSINKEERNNQTFYTINQKESRDENVVKIALAETANGNKVFEINNQVLDVQSNFENSSIILPCETECEHGIIKLEFYLSHKNLVNPLLLQSQFGF